MNPFPRRLPSFLAVIILTTAGNAEAQWFQKRNAAPVPTPLPPQHALPLPPVNPYTHPIQAEPLTATVVNAAPIASPVRSGMPYEGYRYRRPSSPARGGFFGAPKPSPEMVRLLEVIKARAEYISNIGLPYRFGGDHPGEGGLDCSGAMKYLLTDLGFSEMPRTSFDQYAWLKKARTLRHTKTIPSQMGGRKGIKPGDLIFWGGTYNSGHRVSHVMIYLGQGRDGTHYMFGARGKGKTGLHGSGVDVFKLASGPQKGLIGYGSLPGVY